MYWSDTSRVEVNLRINETIRLLIAAKAKIKMSPYKIDVPKLFDSISTLPLQCLMAVYIILYKFLPLEAIQ
ncbi:hypothetical protein QNK12_23695 [Neobacillus cucumis]|nr:hypothetical protein QNK12_23695 [Neobacillus cucumis]